MDSTFRLRYSSKGKEFRKTTKSSIEECVSGVLGLSVIGLNIGALHFVISKKKKRSAFVRETSWRKVLASLLNDEEQEEPRRYPCYRVANVRS